MTWTKTSDDFPDDCWTLSDRAYRLHHEALTWSNRKLLDCRIPRDDLRRFARNGEDGADELVANGWWRMAGDCYVIVHHASYQRTRAEVLRQQEANAANGRKGGRPRKVPREVVGVTKNPAENPVGSRVENPQGQDGTGLGRDELPPPQEHDEEHGLLPDDPDLYAHEWENQR